MKTNTLSAWKETLFIDILSSIKIHTEKKSLLLSTLFITIFMLLFFFPQQALSGVTLKVLEKNQVIQVSKPETELLQTIDKKTHLKSVPAFNATDRVAKNQPVNSQNTNEFSLFNYLSNSQFQLFKDIAHNFVQPINLFWLDFKLKVEKDFALDSFNNLSARMLFIIFIVFLTFVYYSRKQQNKYTQFMPEKSGIEETPLTELDNEKDANISSTVNKDEALTSPASTMVPNQLISNDFPEPQAEVELESEVIQPQPAKNRMELLQAAFENEGYFSETGFIQKDEEHIQEKEPINEETNSSSLLDSVAEIKYIHEMTRYSKIDAFLKITQSDEELSAGSSIDDFLENEISNININEKVDVFIEEFEQLISNLTKQTTILDQEPNELENLIQFKLSIHFISILSDMMQANYLKQFSQTIIEFLEDIVDGKAKMSVDILHRLHRVVHFCDQYMYSLKNSHQVRLEM